jgi:hypothetical protein
MYLCVAPCNFRTTKQFNERLDKNTYSALILNMAAAIPVPVGLSVTLRLIIMYTYFDIF